MKFITIGLLCALAACLAGCEGKHHATEFCKGADGTIQDCSIGCTIEKQAEACKLYETKTIAICDKAGKAACQEICDKDKNEHACAHVKTMK